LLWTETGTLGIRRSDVRRAVLPRHTELVKVGGMPVRVRLGPHRAKAEHDDVAAAAARLELPLRVVAESAEAAAGRTHEEGTP
jgi:pyridinium-3,5-bisthiocarboxylic acid mononucleotide nickel chelatase